MQTWEHDLTIPLELVSMGPIWGNTGISGDPRDGFHIELLSYSPFHPICYMVTVKKKEGEHEALRYRRWDRGHSRNAEGQTRVGWKELLAWAIAGEDD